MWIEVKLEINKLYVLYVKTDWFDYGKRWFSVNSYGLGKVSFKSINKSNFDNFIMSAYMSK